VQALSKTTAQNNEPVRFFIEPAACCPKSFDSLIREMILSLDFWLPFYQEKGKSHSGGELKKK
jgi:hypothetical protein